MTDGGIAAVSGKCLGNPKNAPVREGVYTDVKSVKTACGVAYFGVLGIINDYSIIQGFLKKVFKLFI
ncbi:MAG: hypothetical protein NZ742_01765 [Acidobacteria bacterium]|nr:hypothetical protein [Acidobacteriota bacterium]MDW7983776.1 hypothetical protein [Acidobacteriota bacterium]